MRETIRCGFNLTEVAKALHTSQPGVSRQIRELEDELGVELFVRMGKRLISLTEVGMLIVPIIENMLKDAENLKRAGEEFKQQATGRLSIATTHSQARYALPDAVREFLLRFPGVKFNLHQGTGDQVAELLISGEADIGIATEALTNYESLITLPCFRWSHSVIVRPGHALLDGEALTLARLAEFPIITYGLGYTGRTSIDDAFKNAGLEIDTVLTAMDADVIKTYVELGLGVGIVASIAFDDRRDSGLRALDARHLFTINMTKLAVRRGSFLRAYIYEFIETFAPQLTRDVVRGQYIGYRSEARINPESDTETFIARNLRCITRV